MKSKGFTLLELMFGVGLFAFVLFSLFLAFNHSTRSFQQSVLRQGLQGESLKLNTYLSRDARLTNFHSTQTESRPFTKSGGQVVQRDGLAIASLSDWQNNANFDPVTALPLWDQHIVYYATDDEDSGRLIRQVIDPGGPTDGVPYFGLSTNMRSRPELNSGLLSSLELSANVDSFTTSVNDGLESIEVTLILRKRGGVRRTSAGVRTDDTLESKLVLTTRNTFPRL